MPRGKTQRHHRSDHHRHDHLHFEHPEGMPKPTIVTTDRALRELVTRLEFADEAGFDTEFYRDAQVHMPCLLQVSVDGEDYLVDVMKRGVYVRGHVHVCMCVCVCVCVLCLCGFC